MPIDLQTSLHGREFGLDAGRRVTGQTGFRNPVTVGTTSVNIASGGITTIDTTAAKTYTMDAPVAGVASHLVSTSTSSASRVLNAPTGVTFVSTSNSTGSIVTITGVGSLTVTGLTTALAAAATSGNVAIT